MSLEARIPEMNEKELENLQANAERLVKAGSAKQQAEATRLLPMIAEAIAARKVARTTELAEKKVARAKDLADARVRRAATKKAEAEAAARPDDDDEE